MVAEAITFGLPSREICFLRNFSTAAKIVIPVFIFWGKAPPPSGVEMDRIYSPEIDFVVYY